MSGDIYVGTLNSGFSLLFYIEVETYELWLRRLNKLDGFFLLTNTACFISYLSNITLFSL
jgi:hypothetical protein